MGLLFSCNGKKTKTKQNYYNEIFDGLDLDGTQYLDTDELQTLWEKVQNHKLTMLKKDLDDFTSNKHKDIHNVEKLDASSIIPKNKKFNIKEFLKIMNILKMTNEELHTFWISTKQSEITNIQEVLNKYQ